MYLRVRLTFTFLRMLVSFRLNQGLLFGHISAKKSIIHYVLNSLRSSLVGSIFQQHDMFIDITYILTLSDSDSTEWHNLRSTCKDAKPNGWCKCRGIHTIWEFTSLRAINWINIKLNHIIASISTIYNIMLQHQIRLEHSLTPRDVITHIDFSISFHLNTCDWTQIHNTVLTLRFLTI